MGIPFLTDVQLIAWLQASAWLEAPMRFFTFLGSETFFMFVLPMVYWCIDAGLGMRIGVVLLCSDAVNGIVKLALHFPRPYWVSTQIRAFVPESSFGPPSGHAQNAVAIWGTAAAQSRRRVIAFLACALIFLIGLSRLYLAVHFPLDVLLGWLLGGVILWAFLQFWQRAAAWVKQRPLGEQILLALLIPALLVLCSGLLTYALGGYVLDPDWLTNASRAGDPLPAPLSMDGALMDTGAMFGLVLGLIWIQRGGGFQPSGPVWRRTSCFLVGLLGVTVLYFGLKILLPADDSLLGAATRFVRYAVLGVWVSGGAPIAFARLHLIAPALGPVTAAKPAA